MVSKKVRFISSAALVVVGLLVAATFFARHAQIHAAPQSATPPQTSTTNASGNPAPAQELPPGTIAHTAKAVTTAQFLARAHLSESSYMTVAEYVDAIAKERFRHGFHHAGLARAGGPEKEQISHRTPGGVQSGKKHLVNFDNFFDGRILANDLAPQCGLEVLRIRTTPGRIKSSIKAGPHKFPASFRRGRLL